MEQLNNRSAQVAPVAKPSILCEHGMTSPGGTITIVAHYFRPYIELLRVTEDRYYFRKASTSLLDEKGNKRNWHPRIEHRMLREFHSPNEGILYMALPQTANPSRLSQGELLYIGCSASGGARFWRGKEDTTTRFAVAKSCFHHEQMRRGRNGDSLESFLRSNGPVRIYTLTDHEIESVVSTHKISLPNAKYLAHGLEKRILSEGFSKWAWNKRA